jgi:hypothetical protein
MPTTKPVSEQAIGDDHCPACGAPVAGGRDGCQVLMTEIQAGAYGKPGYASTYDLAFDAYCMQHPETYCVSAKSYAAHLTRLCCGVERGGGPAVYRAINRWLSGPAPIDKPPVLPQRGQMTVADVGAAHSAAEHNALAREWAASVWAAYAHQHDLARQWIELALTSARTERYAGRR